MSGTKISKWFECKIKFEKMMENGMMKTVTETYCVEALSFTEAEARIIQFAGDFISGDMQVVAESIAPYKEIFFGEISGNSTIYYKCKVQFITVNEKNGHEKKTNTCYLVAAENIEKARRIIIEDFESTMANYIISSISETKIMDVFTFVPLKDNIKA